MFLVICWLISNWLIMISVIWVNWWYVILVCCKLMLRSVWLIFLLFISVILIRLLLRLRKLLMLFVRLWFMFCCGCFWFCCVVFLLLVCWLFMVVVCVIVMNFMVNWCCVMNFMIIVLVNLSCVE